MRYSPLPPELYIQNRKRLAAKLEKNALAVFHSNDQMPRSGDTYFPFRQNADLFYLSGIDQEDTVLLIFPDCPQEKFREILFIQKTNEHIAIWEGERYTKEQATKVSGIKTVFWLEDFQMIFDMLMVKASHYYANLNENARFSTEINYRDLRRLREVCNDYPAHSYKRTAPLMHDLRSIKSDHEVKAIQKACDITHKAFERVLKFVKPGVMEYEIEAEIIHEFTRHGADGHAYDPIIASGINACVLHYKTNNHACKDGDVILFDFGASYANYASDMSRVIPVNGKFTDRQRDVYDANLRVFYEARDMLRPGIKLDDFHKEVGKIMEKELIGLGLLSEADVRKQNPDKPLYKKYFMHGTSHFMGLDVHDVGDRDQPLKAGMVFTCEPGIYIREENIGVRIENDILVTADKPLDLMENIPVEAEEIETIMNS